MATGQYLSEAFIALRSSDDGLKAQMATQIKAATAGLKAEIPIVADTRGFAAAANAAIKAAMAAAGGAKIPVKLDIQSDPGRIDAQIRLIKQRMAQQGLGDFLDITLPVGKIQYQVGLLRRLLQQGKLTDFLATSLQPGQILEQGAALRDALSKELSNLTVTPELGIGDLATQIAALKALGGTIPIGVSQNISDKFSILGLAAAEQQLTVLNALLAATTAKADDAAGGGGGGGLTGLAAAAAAGGRGWGLLAGNVRLFGGALSAVPLLGAVGAVHLLADAIIETSAVVIPASIALAAFGVAAIPTVQAITTQMKNMNTVASALGQQMPGLSGGFSRAAAAVQPQVYQIFGDALNIANQRGGAFVTLAKGAGSVVDTWAARMTAAVTSGNGLNQFMANAIPDLQKLGDFAGNLVGAFGNVLHVMPGYAQVLLSVLDDTSKFIEATTRVAQPLIGFGLAAHGALLYTGLLGTGLSFLITRGLALVPGIATSAASGLEKIGASGAAAALTKIGAQSKALSQLPWGWISIAAAGFGILVFKLLQVKDAAQQFNAELQQQLLNVPVLQLQTTLMADQVITAENLANAQQNLTTVVKNNTAVVGDSRAEWERSGIAISQAQQKVSDFSSGQSQLSQESKTVSSNLKALGGSWGLINAAGITSAQMLSNNSANLAEMKAAVLGTTLSLKEMGQQSGLLGTDLEVMNFLVSSQYTDMQNLNSQWDTFLSNVTKMEGNSASAVTAFTQLTADAKKTGASFLGVNANSITLQNDFNSNLFPAVQQVIDGMRSAQAPVKTLAQYMSTLLAPAVNAGALANDGMRTAIFDMAQEAGYTGPNKIGPLTAFIDKNRGSLQAAHDEALKYAGALAQIPSQIATTVLFGGSGQITVTTALKNVIAHISRGFAGGTSGAAPGWAWVGEQGPELAYFSGGETVIPNHMIGYAGGVIGNVPAMASFAMAGTQAVQDAAAYTMDHKAAEVTARAIRLAVNAQQGGLSNYVPGAGVQQWAGVTSQAIQLAGALASVNQVLYQMQTESGGNPYAVNLTDINAQMGHPSVGLLQVIKGTFDMFAGPYINTGPFAYGVSENPLANIYSAIKYAEAVYGPTLMSGGNGLGSGHGYARGTHFPRPARAARIVAAEPQKITLEVVPSGSGSAELDRLLTAWLQKSVIVRGGGNVQAAWGSGD